MTRQVRLAMLAACALPALACQYIVFPEEEGGAAAAENKGWSAEPIRVAQTAAGDLRIELALRNDTGQWSAMKALPKPARLVGKGRSETACETVFVSSGGHRLAPGYRMRAYIGGRKLEQKLQPIAVECKGVQTAAGAKLLVDYQYVYGMYNYYEQHKNETSATLEVNLDKVASSLSYPVAQARKDDTFVKADAKLPAMNAVEVTLVSVARDGDALAMTWRTANPGEYPTRVHLGVTPLIGSDGVVYGFYELPDLVDAPLTPSKGNAEWTTKVAVPKDVTDLRVLLSVETGKKGLFQNYAVDLAGKLPRG